MTPTPLGSRRVTTTPAAKTTPAALHRNVAEPWLRKYLNTVSDWQTYLAPNGGSVGERADAVTDSFFGAGILKGAAFVLGAHLCQQATASAATILSRDWLRGEDLGQHKGIMVRKLQLARRKKRHPLPQDKALSAELELFTHFSGLGERVGNAQTTLARKVQLQDSYTFTEGGRAWVCYTLHFPASRRGEAERKLTVLSLLSFPNRSYYFDRLLPFNLAVEITRGLTAPAGVPGFVGDTVELDLLLPLIRLAKLGLYGLNWYLIDPAERDAGPAIDDAASGYDKLIPPGGTGGGFGSGGSKGNPYTTRPTGRGRRTSRTPYTPTGFSSWGSWGSTAAPQAPPPPDYFGAPPPPVDYYGAQQPAGTPVQTSFLPQTGNTASTNIGPAPVKVAINLENKTGGQETVWVTVEEDAYQVVDRLNQPTGLSIAPAVSLNDKGDFITSPNHWHVVHAETGKLLNPTPLTSLHHARQLADQLTAVVDWRRPFSMFTAQDRERAQTVLSQLS